MMWRGHFLLHSSLQTTFQNNHSPIRTIVFQEWSFFENILFYNIAISEKPRILRTKSDFCFHARHRNCLSERLLHIMRFLSSVPWKNLTGGLSFFIFDAHSRMKKIEKKFFHKGTKNAKNFDRTLHLMQILKSCDNFFDEFADSSRLHGILSMTQTHGWNAEKCCILQQGKEFFGKGWCRKESKPAHL